MDNLVSYDRFAKFSDAAEAAKAFAISNAVPATVRRYPNGWEVLVPVGSTASGASLADLQRAEDDAESGSHYDDDGNDSYEEMRELHEEIESDQEDWARSDEDGWYYGDE
jgi:hypothetical protein